MTIACTIHFTMYILYGNQSPILALYSSIAFRVEILVVTKSAIGQCPQFGGFQTRKFDLNSTRRTRGYKYQTRGPNGDCEVHSHLQGCQGPQARNSGPKPIRQSSVHNCQTHGQDFEGRRIHSEGSQSLRHWFGLESM